MTIKGIFTSKPILILEIGIILFLAFKVGKEIYKKRGIEREITRLEAEIGQLEKDKNGLSSLLSYVQTDTWVEEEAREKLNLAKAGESLVLFPQANNPEAAAAPELSTALDLKNEESNLKRWWQYFFEHDRL